MPLPNLPGVQNASLVVDLSGYQANADLAVAKANGVGAALFKAT
jgi:GH25 family lysozyme M1 (1,4-beta-N-acetylmuramidase)